MLSVTVDSKVPMERYSIVQTYFPCILTQVSEICESGTSLARDCVFGILIDLLSVKKYKILMYLTLQIMKGTMKTQREYKDHISWLCAG